MSIFETVSGLLRRTSAPATTIDETLELQADAQAGISRLNRKFGAVDERRGLNSRPWPSGPASKRDCLDPGSRHHAGWVRRRDRRPEGDGDRPGPGKTAEIAVAPRRLEPAGVP